MLPTVGHGLSDVWVGADWGVSAGIGVGSGVGAGDRSDGDLGGYSGIGGVKTKKNLLKKEGFSV